MTSALRPLVQIHRRYGIQGRCEIYSFQEYEPRKFKSSPRNTDGQANGTPPTRLTLQVASFLLVIAGMMTILAVPAFAQSGEAPAPTPIPDPSSVAAIFEWGLWILVGIVVAAIVMFVVIARLSRDSSGRDDD